MKTVIAIVFLLFAFTTKSYFFGVANAANNPVLDIDGDEVRTGVEYYIISQIWGAGGGGLALGRANNQPCPEIVVQRRSDLDSGTPVVFSNADSSDNVVRISSDINIQFVPIRDRLCTTSTVWEIDNYDPSTGKWWVTTGGVTGNPGPSTLLNWFKIEGTGASGYKFRYCPSVCESCITLCSDIGRYEDVGQRRLALSDNGWSFIIIKASRAKTIKQVLNAKSY